MNDNNDTGALTPAEFIAGGLVVPGIKMGPFGPEIQKGLVTPMPEQLAALAVVDAIVDALNEAHSKAHYNASDVVDLLLTLDAAGYVLSPKETP